MRWAAHRLATTPWAAWNARTVGRPGGGGSMAWRVKYPAMDTTEAVIASLSASRQAGCFEMTASGGGPPCMATLGAKATTSNQEGPLQAWGQSRNQTFSGVSRMLSARMSMWRSVSPDRVPTAFSSMVANVSMWCRDQSFRRSRREGRSFNIRRQPQICVANMSDAVPTIELGSGDGVNVAPRSSMAATARSSSSDTPRLGWMTSFHILEDQPNPAILAFVVRPERDAWHRRIATAWRRQH